MVQISELAANMKNVSVIGKLTLGEIREVNKKDGSTGRVMTAILDDGSGAIKLSLWDDQVTQFSNGDTVEVENGYTTAYREQTQLNVGRFGKIAKVENIAQ